MYTSQEPSAHTAPSAGEEIAGRSANVEPDRSQPPDKKRGIPWRATAPRVYVNRSSLGLRLTSAATPPIPCRRPMRRRRRRIRLDGPGGWKTQPRREERRERGQRKRKIRTKIEPSFEGTFCLPALSTLPVFPIAGSKACRCCRHGNSLDFEGFHAKADYDSSSMRRSGLEESRPRGRTLEFAAPGCRKSQVLGPSRPSWKLLRRILKCRIYRDVVLAAVGRSGWPLEFASGR